VPTPDPSLLVLQPVPFFGRRPEGLREQLDPGDPERRLSPLRPDGVPHRADDVPRVELVEHGLVPGVAELVDPGEQLERTVAVVEVEERALAVLADRPEAPGDGEGLGRVVSAGHEGLRRRGDRPGRNDVRELVRVGEPARGADEAELPSPFGDEVGLLLGHARPTGA
jgi:hypothetical protein